MARWFGCVVTILGLLAAFSSQVQGSTTEPIYRVALVDKFYPRDYGLPPERSELLQRSLYGVVDVDKDRDREPFYHGDVVEMLVAHPRIQVIRYPMAANQKPMTALLEQLQKLHANIQQLPVNAVLLPWESSTLISSLDDSLDTSRVQDYVAKLREWGKRDEVWNTTVSLIEELEGLVRDGVRVVTIAGNGGRGMVNTLSFARGVMTVGAVEPELRHFVSDNVFVNHRERAAYMFRRVDGSNGRPRGYDLDEDGCPEVMLAQLTGFTPTRTDYPKETWRSIRGSSFAAPRALRKLLVGSAPDFCYR